MVRGSPRLLAYQPVIYVKILAKRDREGKKKEKASNGKHPNRAVTQGTGAVKKSMGLIYPASMQLPQFKSCLDNFMLRSAQKTSWPASSLLPLPRRLQGVTRMQSRDVLLLRVRNASIMKKKNRSSQYRIQTFVIIRAGKMIWCM